MTIAAHGVRRRHVFFLSGFDPKGASWYHALYRAQAAAQSRVNAMAISVGNRRRGRDGNSHWQVDTASRKGVPCETTYEYSRWDDIVRMHWPRSAWGLLRDLVFAYWLILRSGEMINLWKMARKPMVGLLYPLAVLGGGVVSALVVGAGVAWALRALGAGMYMAGAAALLACLACGWFTWWLEGRLNTTWLVRIFSFTCKRGLGKTPELERRLDQLAERIEEKLRAGDVDEILVVGFSVGSILAVSALARVLRSSTVSGATREPPTLSLLTLGHCIPALGLMPRADDFRKDLGALAADRRLHWVDFSSPTDWGSFALVDPVTACRVERPAHMRGHPAMRSPRFHTMFRQSRYRELRLDKRRMHLQYLMAGELASEYDYYLITAGSLTLQQRFSGRQSGRP